MCACMNTYIYVYVYIYIYMGERMCRYVYTCVYVCMYVCICMSMSDCYFGRGRAHTWLSGKMYRKTSEEELHSGLVKTKFY